MHGASACPTRTRAAPAQVAFAADAAAAVAVAATRAHSRPTPRAAGGGAAPPAPRDFLLLRPGGRLALHMGARAVCEVALRPPPARGAGADALARLAGWGDEGAPAGRRPATPRWETWTNSGPHTRVLAVLRKDEPRAPASSRHCTDKRGAGLARQWDWGSAGVRPCMAWPCTHCVATHRWLTRRGAPARARPGGADAEGSDAAMSTGDGDEEMLSPGGSGPDVAALGAALEAAPEAVDLRARPA